jgi:hypothetical protein
MPPGNRHNPKRADSSESRYSLGKAGERFKVACGCQPPRSFWIRAQQYTPGTDLRRSLRPGLPTSGRRQQQSR